jgi:hypothetical protein
MQGAATQAMPGASSRSSNAADARPPPLPSRLRPQPRRAKYAVIEAFQWGRRNFQFEIVCHVPRQDQIARTEAYCDHSSERQLLFAPSVTEWR